jgi:tetratricopeptide (TPR) repeat protein
MHSNASKNGWRSLLQIAILGVILLHAIPALASTVKMEQQARIYYQSGNKEQSLSLFEKIFKQHPNFTHQKNLAYFHREFQSYIRAQELLLDLLEKHPRNVDVLLALGALSISKHQYANGIAFFRRATVESPLNDYAVERLANAYFGDGQPKKAIATLQSYHNVSKQFPLTHRVLMATIQQHVGNHATAISLYKTLVQQPGNAITAQLLLAGAIGYVDPLRAQSLFEKMVSDNSQRVDVWASFAAFLQQIGKPTPARKAYKHAAELLSKKNMALMLAYELLLAGDYYAKAEDSERARQILENGLERFPWDVRFNTKLGWVNLAMDNMPGAEVHFKAAYAAVPSDPYHSLALAELYQRRNMHSKYLQFEAHAAQNIDSPNTEFSRLMHNSVYQHGLRVAPHIGISALAGFHSSGQATDSLLRGFALTGSRQSLFISEQIIGAKLSVTGESAWSLQLGQYYINRSEDRDESDSLTEIKLSRVVPNFFGYGDLVIQPSFKYSNTNEALDDRKRTFHESGLQLDMDLYNSRWNWSFLARKGADDPNYIEEDNRFSEVKFSLAQSPIQGMSLFFSAAQQNNTLDSGLSFKTRTFEAGIQNNFSNGFSTGFLLRQVTDNGLNLSSSGAPQSHSLTLSLTSRPFKQFTPRMVYEIARGSGVSDFDRTWARFELVRPIQLGSSASRSSDKVSVSVPLNISFGIEHLDYSSGLDADESYAFLKIALARL